MNGPILSADFGYLRVTIYGTKFQTSVPVYQNASIYNCSIHDTKKNSGV